MTGRFYPKLGDIGVFAMYLWVFDLKVLSKNKSKKRLYQITVSETDYDVAKRAMQNTLKSKQVELLRIRSVRIKRVAWAFYKTEGSPWVPEELYQEIPLPPIPDIL